MKKYGKFKFDKSPDLKIREIEGQLLKNKVGQHKAHKKSRPD
jgi:hypothetical protein